MSLAALSTINNLSSFAEDARAWPFEEARRLLKRLDNKLPEKGYVLFETGYGPSGLPHIGTFGEVVRTTMVRRAFEALTGWPTRLFCVSDDMDGMRKIPENYPNREILEPHLQRPLTAVPDPFGTHESFGHHNNARLRAFLDSFGFEYEFLSATDLYKSGAYDAMLLRTLECYDRIMNIMLPTLGPERRATYSPFLPISPTTGRVLYVPLKAIDAKAGTISFADEDGTDITLPVTGGNTKLQWKPDFGMRWAALGVDFEMFGKDHQPNMGVYSAICQALGVIPPVQFVYELFLDSEGQKISKSKGNGLSVEDWLRYAPPESLSLYMYQKPKQAKRLYFDVIPKSVDDYVAYRDAFAREETAARLENPAWHIHHGTPPAPEPGTLSFSILLNLAAVVNAEEKGMLWGFISRYTTATPETAPFLDKLAGYAVAYYQDFVKPTKQYRVATETEKAAFGDLATSLKNLAVNSDAETIQTEVYTIGKKYDYANLRDWFLALYQILLGQDQGPRMGSFFALYGIDNSLALIENVVATGSVIGHAPKTWT